MKTYLTFLMVAAASVASFGAIPAFNDDFETNLYVQGVALATNGWQASGTSAYVTNSGGVGNSRAAFMDGIVVLTNSLTADAGLKVWTDFQLKPQLGVDTPDLPTNTASFLFYFDSNGVMQVDTAAGWQACTNDVWGNPIAPATNNAYVRLSLFQDYSRSTQAVFLDGRLILQDLRFTGTAPNFNRLVVQNAESNCWLDNVWIKTNFDTASLTNDFNGDSLADAREVNDYGYARRTLYVCQGATNLVPLYASITNAVGACRSRDIIHVIAGDYSGETVALAANLSNVMFEGDAFTLAGLSVASNASVSLAQTLTCMALTVSGQVALVSGASLNLSSAAVAGTLSMSSNATLVVTNLAVTGSGLVVIPTHATLVAVTAGVTVDGPVTLSSTWGSGTVASMPLPFTDSFDAYGENTALTALKAWGWNASAASVKVQGAVANSGKAVIVPEGGLVTNSITSVATKIWTDFYVRPVLGAEPWYPATNTSSFLAYVNTNGYLVVATAGGGWLVCSNALDNTPAPAMRTDQFTRITLCQDLGVTPRLFSVFVDGKLVAEGLSSPFDAGAYASFGVDNKDDTAYVDDVMIATAIPSALTNGPSSDLNNNRIPDALEIQLHNLTSLGTTGAVFKFR